jgi:hypothetical protein
MKNDLPHYLSKTSTKMSEEESAILGGCYCKAITYTILPPTQKEIEQGDPNLVGPGGQISANHCHCDTCRIICGGLFQTLAQVTNARMKITDSKGSLTHYQSPNAMRGFCNICGTTLWIKDEPETGYINVSVGTMDKDDAKKWVHIRHHIFLGDTLNGGVWEFQDDLPKYHALILPRC